MNNLSEKPTKYAGYFTAYLLKNLSSSESRLLRQIILYGSVASGTAKKQSDIDIFIDVRKEQKKFTKSVEKITEDFYNSRESAVFKAENIINKFSIKIGKLDNWKSLKRSITNTGIILWGHFKTQEKSSKHKLIFHWDKINKNRGAFLNKLYGYKIKGKKYKGLLEQANGKKLGKSCILISSEFREDVVKLIKKHEVNAKVVEVFTD